MSCSFSSSRFHFDGLAVENANVLPRCTFHHLSLLRGWCFWQNMFSLRFVTVPCPELRLSEIIHHSEYLAMEWKCKQELFLKKSCC